MTLHVHVYDHRSVDVGPTLKQAIKHYTEFGHNHINRSLRGEVETHPEAQKVINKLDEGISKSKPSSEERHFYRGRNFNKPTHFKVGQTISDPGFVSVSTSENVARRFADPGNTGKSMHHAKVFHITSPVGHKSLDLTPHSGAWHEPEHLLPRGSKFRVEKLSRESRMVGFKNGKEVRKPSHVQTVHLRHLP